MVPAAPPGFRFAGIVAKMVFTSQLLTQSQTARVAAVGLLGGLPGSESVVQQCEDLVRELSGFRDQVRFPLPFRGLQFISAM